MRYTLVLFCLLSFIYCQTNDPVPIEKGEKSPFSGTLMTEDLANYYVNIDEKYYQLVDKYKELKTNQLLLNDLNLRTESAYQTTIDLKNKETEALLKFNKSLKITLSIGIPTASVLGFTGGALLVLKLTEFTLNFLKSKSY